MAQRIRLIPLKPAKQKLQTADKRYGQKRGVCAKPEGTKLTTEYHAKLFAHELTRQRSVADSEKLAGALLDAQVDLNPHQVEAALFVVRFQVL